VTTIFAFPAVLLAWRKSQRKKPDFPEINKDNLICPWMSKILKNIGGYMHEEKKSI
jgi:hypothetical protein